MSNKFGDDLKRIFSGLAYQNVGEYLTVSEKMTTLGYGASEAANLTKTKRLSSRRIALISDGAGFGASLDYAIDSCLHQDAQFDLLLHGDISEEKLSVVEYRLRQAGLTFRIVRLANADAIADYTHNNASLVFLISQAGDSIARSLVDTSKPKHSRHLPVPLVFIDEKPANSELRRSAA